MLDTARTTAQRAQFEVELIEEALSSASQDRSKVVTETSPAVSKPPQNPSPQEIRERVLGIIGKLGRASPKAVRQEINDESINVYNALSRLLTEGKLTRQDGIYELSKASPNGHQPGGGEQGGTGLQVATG